MPVLEYKTTCCEVRKHGYHLWIPPVPVASRTAVETRIYSASAPPHACQHGSSPYWRTSPASPSCAIPHQTGGTQVGSFVCSAVPCLHHPSAGPYRVHPFHQHPMRTPNPGTHTSPASTPAAFSYPPHSHSPQPRSAPRHPMVSPCPTAPPPSRRPAPCVSPPPWPPSWPGLSSTP